MRILFVLLLAATANLASSATAPIGTEHSDLPVESKVHDLKEDASLSSLLASESKLLNMEKVVMDAKNDPKKTLAMLVEAKEALTKAYNKATAHLNRLEYKLKPKKKFSKAQKKHWGKINKAWFKFKVQKKEIDAMPDGNAKWSKRLSLAKAQLKLVVYNIRWTKGEVANPSNPSPDWKVKCEKNLKRFESVIQLRRKVVDKMKSVLRLKQEKEKALAAMKAANALIARLKAKNGNQELGDAAEQESELAKAKRLLAEAKAKEKAAARKEVAAEKQANTLEKEADDAEKGTKSNSASPIKFAYSSRQAIKNPWKEAEKLNDKKNVKERCSAQITVTLKGNVKKKDEFTCTACRPGFAFKMMFHKAMAGKCEPWNVPEAQTHCTELDGTLQTASLGKSKNILCTKIAQIPQLIQVWAMDKKVKKHFASKLGKKINAFFVRCRVHKQVGCRGGSCEVKKRVGCHDICKVDTGTWRPDERTCGKVDLCKMKYAEFLCKDTTVLA